MNRDSCHNLLTKLPGSMWEKIVYNAEVFTYLTKIFTYLFTG